LAAGGCSQRLELDRRASLHTRCCCRGRARSHYIRFDFLALGEDARRNPTRLSGARPLTRARRSHHRAFAFTALSRLSGGSGRGGMNLICRGGRPDWSARREANRRRIACFLRHAERGRTSVRCSMPMSLLLRAANAELGARGKGDGTVTAVGSIASAPPARRRGAARPDTSIVTASRAVRGRGFCSSAPSFEGFSECSARSDEDGSLWLSRPWGAAGMVGDAGAVVDPDNPRRSADAIAGIIEEAGGSGGDKPGASLVRITTGGARQPRLVYAGTRKKRRASDDGPDAGAAAIAVACSIL